MSKSFRLGQVLDHARVREEAQAAALAALDAECRRSRAALQQLRDQESAQLAALSATVRRGAFDPAATEASQHYLARLERAIGEQRTHLAEAEARREASRADLLAIAREKRLLERLEERHDESAAAESARRESTRSDELSGQRHQRQQQRPHGEVA